jgi:hypothetical protein
MNVTPRNICASASPRCCADSKQWALARKGKDTMANMRKYAASRFLKLDDVIDQPRHETIVEVTDGKWDKPVLKFESGAQFSLNKVNTGDMIEAYGDESDGWVGVTIELFAGKVKYGGESTDSVRIRPVTPPTPKPSGRAELDDEVPY